MVRERTRAYGKADLVDVVSGSQTPVRPGWEHVG